MRYATAFSACPPLAIVLVIADGPLEPEDHMRLLAWLWGWSESRLPDNPQDREAAIIAFLSPAPSVSPGCSNQRASIGTHVTL